MSDYAVVITDLLGNNIAFLDGFNLETTRRLSSFCDGKFELKSRDPALAGIFVGKRAVKVYRNGLLRAHGRIWEPLSYDQDKVTVEFRDPWGVIQNRRIRAQTRFDQIEAFTIAWDLIEAQNGYYTTRLRQAAQQGTSQLRDRTYDPGKLVGEAVEQLSEVLNSFWFRIDPVDGVAGTQGEFVTLYPDSGSTRPTCLFEYGDETSGTIETYEVQVLLPRNRVTARGALVGGDAASTQLTSVFQDDDSILEYDLYDDEVSFSDVSEQTTLDQHAAEELRPAPIKTYSFVPLPGRGPMLWDDFDVGDIISFRILNGAFEEAGTGRVTACTVKASDNGAEQITNLTMEQLVSSVVLPPPVPPPPPILRDGTIHHGTAQVIALVDTSDLTVGMAVTGTGIPLGTKILSIDSPTQVTLTKTSVTYWTKSCFGATPLNVLSSIDDTSQFAVGMYVVGSISSNGNDPMPTSPARGYFIITSIDSSTQITCDVNKADSWYLGNGNINVGLVNPGGVTFAAAAVLFQAPIVSHLTFQG